MKYLQTLIFLLLAVFCQGQILDLSGVVYSAGTGTNLITLSTTSLSGFSTNQGSASSSLTFTVSGTSLTAAVSLSVSGSYEISTNNTTFSTSASLPQSGGSLTGQPVTIYVRIAASAAAGTVTGTVNASSTGAATKTVNLTGTVNSLSPTLSTSTNSLSAFANTTGTASASQSFTLSGSNLTASAIVTPPSGFEASTDNSTFQSTLTITQSGGSLVSQPVTIWIRVAASTAAGSYSNNVVISSTGATNKNVAVSATVSSAGGATVAKFAFGKDASMTGGTGWTKVYGRPSDGLTFTDAGTGWTIKTYAGKWQAFAGDNYASNIFGANSGTFGTLFPAGVVLGSFLNSGILFDTSTQNYGIHIDNLPAGNYTVQILGSVQSAVNNQVTTPVYHVDFGSEADQPQNTMNNQDNTGFPVNTTHVLSFTGNIGTGEILRIGVFAGSGFVPGGGAINAIIITKN